MGNVNIQGVIPLAGRGHTFRKNGGFIAGEYKQLIDAELDEDGRIVNRRNITRTGINAESFSEPLGYVGHLGKYAIVQTRTEQYAVSHNEERITMWDPNDYLIGGGGIKYVFYYNGYNYWLCQNGTNFQLERYANSVAYPTPASYASLSHLGTVFTSTTIGGFKSAFMFKDRLWVATADKVYFSKATDPTNFTVPDGGFFGFSGANVNYAIANKDNVYVICDSAVYMINYGTDPNQDATVRVVSNVVGGDYACLYEDNVYFSKDDILYVIVNSTINRIMDLNLGFQGSMNVFTKMSSFAEYIVILRHSMQTTSNGTPYPKGTNTGADEPPGMYFVNMVTGAIHGIGFFDGVDGQVTYGTISDVLFVPIEDNTNNLYLHIMTMNSSTTHKGHCYTMPVTKVEIGYSPIADTKRNYTTDGTEPVSSHNITVELSSYTPDGNEYNVKKFRSLLLQGKFPTSDIISLRVAYDNNAYGETVYLNSSLDLYDSGRSPFPVRVPLNQRARSISLKFKGEIVQAGDFNEFTVEDIRTLWTYTKRLPINKNQDVTVS